MVLEETKTSGGQTVLAPSHVSATSQMPAEMRQVAPALPAGCWQASFVPSHSSRLHGLPSEVQAVPAGSLASAGQFGPVPGQFSAGSQSPFDARHSVLDDANPSAGQTVLVPSHVSATSQVPAAARQVAPAFPAGCWQVSLVPLHSSRLHGLPSDVQAVPLAFFASAGQEALAPVQFSVRSHSPASRRQTVLEDSKPSAGQTVLVPVQVSATSQMPAAARQVAPALPGGCWHVSLVPSHSSSEHGLPSEVQSDPEGFFASAGHGSVGRPPQFSAMSHSPAAGRHVNPGSVTSAGQVGLTPVHSSSGSHASPEPARQTAPALPAGCWQVTFVPSHWSTVHTLPSVEHGVAAGVRASAGQAGPVPGQFSAGSHSPADARHSVELGSKASAGQTVLAPVHVSATSQIPAATRQVAPALPAGC
jgi:hypothetical protein